MANYFVTYDLFDPGQNYDAVEKAIQASGRAVKLLQTVWYLSSSLKGEDIRTKVWSAMDSNDRLLVIEASNAWGQNIADNWDTLLSLWRAKTSA